MLIQRIARDKAVDRLDPAYLAQWRAYYRHTVAQYVAGTISRVDAHNALMSLGYRDAALTIELLELDEARSKGLSYPKCNFTDKSVLAPVKADFPL
ncbi:hypothetical protein Q2941_47200 [Bradyrhizobium sp. UFLA05-153]